MSSEQKRIAGALLLGAAVIAGALFIRSDSPTSTPSTDATVLVTAAPERTAIPELDKNGDGVPDWQEALQTTEPLDIDYSNTNYEAPDTLTGQFALEFFEDIVRAENYGSFGDTPEELVSNASNDLVQAAYDTLLTEKDITITGDNSQAYLSSYGEAIAQITSNAPSSVEESEIAILENSLRAQDPEELRKLEGKIEAYTYMFEKTKELSTPSLMVKEHLDLINSYQAVLADIKAMQNSYSDPMKTLLRIKRYQDDASGLYTSIVNLYTKLLDNGATWDDSSVVFSLIGIGENN